MAEARQKLSLAAWAWVWVAGLALFELVAEPLIHAAVPRDASWEAAAAFVRSRYEPNDRIVSAPTWADPIVRHHLGDLQSLRMAAPADDAGVERVWELGIRGASTRLTRPALEEPFGEVRVRMWPVSTGAIVYDFVEELANAEVDVAGPEGPRPCLFQRVPPGRGGLGRGPLAPAERFVCDVRRPWLWVGATVLADLELRPRRCVWQHPAGPEPVRVTYSDVPLAERLVVHAGIDYHAERERRHGPVTLRVWIDDRLAGELIHRDGDGWSRLEIDTGELAPGPAAVRFETTAEDPTARLFCWAGSAQTRPRHE